MRDRNKGIIGSTSELPWIDFGDGTEIQILRLGVESPAWTIMIRNDAGVAAAPPHIHLAEGELLVLEGSGHHPETGPFKAGDFIYEHAGARHGQVQLHEPTLLLQSSAGACVFLDADGGLETIMDADYLRGLAEEAGVGVPVEQ